VRRGQGSRGWRWPPGRGSCRLPGSRRDPGRNIACGLVTCLDPGRRRQSRQVMPPSRPASKTARVHPARLRISCRALPAGAVPTAPEQPPRAEPGNRYPQARRRRPIPRRSESARYSRANVSGSSAWSRSVIGRRRRARTRAGDLRVSARTPRSGQPPGIGCHPRPATGKGGGRLGMGPAVVPGQDLAEVAGPAGDGAAADLAARDPTRGNGHGEAAGTWITHQIC